MDAEQGEKASYTEYEDSTGEYLMSVEHWDGETEYAKGYYLDKDEIEIASDSQQVKIEQFVWIIIIVSQDTRKLCKREKEGTIKSLHWL